MKKSEKILRPDDPHLNLLLDKTKQGKQVRHVPHEQLQTILNALSESDARYVACQVKLAQRSLWQHARDSFTETLSELPNRMLPEWLTSRI